ncbi:MAG: hypothetical protein ACT4PE_02120 [Candidatus Eiseniibacteriota bacterium]
MTGVVAAVAAPADSAAAPSAASEEPPLLEGQLLDGDTLLRAGLVRLSDVFLLAEGWSVSTIENWSWRATPPGLGTLDRPAWELIVDARPLSGSDPFGNGGLHRVPLSLERIESVELVDLPQLRHGRFLDGGGVVVRTRRPARGAGLRARYATGSETGDPGPFEFTPLGTPNAERLGHEANLSAAAAGEAAWAEAGLVVQRHFAGDALLAGRYAGLSTDDPRVFDAVAPSLHAGFRGERLSWEIAAGHSRIFETAFVEGIGSELPVDSRFTDVCVRSTLALAGEREIGVELASTRDDPHGRANSFGLDPGEGRRIDRAELAGRSGNLEFGAGTEQRRIVEETTTALRLWGGWGRSAALLLERDRRDFAASASVAGSLATPAAGRLELSLSRSERRRAEEAGPWFRIERGSELLDDAGVAVTFDGSIEPVRTTSADLRWRGGVRALSVSASGFARRQQGITIAAQHFGPDPAGGTVRTPITVLGGRGGWVGGGAIAVERRLGPAATARASWHWQETLSGDGAFRELRRAEPRHQARALVDWTPSVPFTLRAMLRWTAATTWTEYTGMARLSGGQYTERIGERWELDLSLRKSLLGRRANAGATFRNVLDDEVRLHPIGAGWRMSFLVHLDVRGGP